MMGNKLRCIAVDDEPFALEIISEDIQKIEFLDLLGAYFRPGEAHARIEANDVDLMFLDIQMPGLLGTQFLRKISNPPMVVFTTAYDQYAIEGFELDVVDYLLKPIPFARFRQAAEKAKNLFELRQPREESEPFLMVFSEYKKLRIPFQDILYIEGLKDYVKIVVTTQSKPILTRMNLKGMESKLASEKFCRVHQSYIVSLNKVTSALKSKVNIGSIQIPVGDKFSENFIEKYHKNGR